MSLSKSTKSTSSFRIRLTGTIPNTKPIKKEIIEIAPQQTMNELIDTVRMIFLEENSQDEKNNNKYNIELWISAGHPPRRIDTSVVSENAYVSDFLRGGDGVTVRFVTTQTSSTTTKTKTKTKKIKASTIKTVTTQKKGNGQILKKKGNNNNNNKKKKNDKYEIEVSSSSEDEDNIPVPRNTKRRTPSTRQAAIIATSTNIPLAIQAQEAFLREEKKVAANKKRKISNSGGGEISLANTFQKNKKKEILKKAAETRITNSRLARFDSLPKGRRLNEDDNNNPPLPSSPKNKKVSSKLKLKSEQDVTDNLLKSITNPSKGGKIGSFLRGALRNAVGKTMEVRRANVRLGSLIVSEKFITFRRLDGGCTTATSTTISSSYVGKYEVCYPKGIDEGGGGKRRLEHQEIHDILSIEALKAVIISVHAEHYHPDEDIIDDEGNNDGDNNNKGGREMLRPRNMAQLSPRVFWSLWFHYGIWNRVHVVDDNYTNDATITTTATTMEEALRQISPNLNWNFLNIGRIRTLSTKARENKQIENSNYIHDKFDRDEYNRSVKAVKDVENAMIDTLSGNNNNSNNNNNNNNDDKNVDNNVVRDKRAKAALQRLEAMDTNKNGYCNETNQQDEMDIDNGDSGCNVNVVNNNNKYNNKRWKLITPTEIDLNELIECIREGGSDCDDGDGEDGKKESSFILSTPSSSPLSLLQQQTYSQQYKHFCSYWANVLIDKCSIHNWRELANVEESSALIHSLIQSHNNNNRQPNITAWSVLKIPTVDEVETWIDIARLRSIDEIMIDIILPPPPSASPISVGLDKERKHPKNEISSYQQKRSSNNNKNILFGVDEIYEALRENANAGTPKDVASWGSLSSCGPEMLLDFAFPKSSILPSSSTSSSSSLMSSSSTTTQSLNKFRPGVDDAKRWCERAKIALHTIDWLSWYATPVLVD